VTISNGMADPSAQERSSLAALSAVLGAKIIRADRMTSGDRGATWRLATTIGSLVVRSSIERRAAERWVVASSALADAGLPAPRARVVETDPGTWLVMDDIVGQPGQSWLDTPDRSRTLARSMGSIWRRMHGVDIRGVLPTMPTAAWVAPGFVHGDFAPINVIVDGAGTVVGLIDLEHSHVGDPLEDVAWWGWVVRHHHPEAWLAAWPTLCEAAGVDDRDEAIRGLMLDQLERRLALAPDDTARRRWLARRDEAAAW
jgi:aminoglycoside phosphotransferase (APT) family kinase protein